MSTKLSRACDRFAKDERGNIAVLFCAAAVPMIGLLGGAVDMTRHNRYKTEVVNALDSAAVALARRGAKNDADADKFVTGYMNALLGSDKRDPMLHLASFNAVKINGGYRVESSGYMDTAFMPVVGIRRMSLDLQAEVALSNGNYEVALALDNTGSMQQHGRIGALRDAAGNLVDDLYKQDGAKDRVRMALVPFVTAVNIKTPGVYDPSWIDPTGDPAIFGGNFATPVDRLSLFTQMGVQWSGCVEARQAPYDEVDARPVNAATRFVPYLWPDEPDHGFGNSYLADIGGGSPWDRLKNVDKYKVAKGTKVSDTSSKGPNAACPRPIVELTNDTERMHHEIEQMVPHNVSGGNSSGTNVAQGLMWGWSVLSHDAPYTQGAPDDDKNTQKVLVLLSDGRNQIVTNKDVTGSDYTSYGYLAAGRLGSKSEYLTAEKTVDGKVGRICQNIKAKGIRLYTILFEVDYASTQDIFRECASKDEEGKPLYYYVPDSGQLQAAFSAIGQDLTSLHISR